MGCGVADIDKWFIEQAGVGAEADGFSRIAGRLFAALLLSAEPRSLDSLVAELGVSKASISIEARRLVERAVARRVGVPGDRRDYYQLVPHFFSGLVRARVERWGAMRELAAQLLSSDPTLAPVVRDRLAEMEAVHDLIVIRVEEALHELEQRAAHADAVHDSLPSRSIRTS
jgi:DNA-binding transcriptional regulator GbsR (MarR family)